MNVSLLSNSEEDRRGQTEPLAALIAVTVMGLALSFYVGQYASVVSNGDSDRDMSDTTLERVWADIESRGAYDARTPLEDLILPESLPEGSNVYIRITYVDEDGEIATVDSITVTESGQIQAYPTTLPAETQTASRPVGIRYGTRDVRGGRLHIEVET